MRKIRDLPANEHPHELLAIILGKDSQKNE
jgi:hypothetical protein